MVVDNHGGEARQKSCSYTQSEEATAESGEGERERDVQSRSSGVAAQEE